MSTAESETLDPIGDFIHYENAGLDAIFAPKTVAVIGASEKNRSVGRTVLWNLISSPFGGVVFPVNPQHNSVMGITAYPSVLKVPEKIDLAIIATPAKVVPDLIKECVEAGVKSAIILSAGFKEMGPSGVQAELQILAHARRGKMRIIGPNCLGVMNPLSGLNATFAGSMARPGSVAFISQSGALCTAILDWSIRELVGFSAFVSIGSMVDVDWGDLIDYFGHDPCTHSIVLYMESIGHARSFLSAAREVALRKPIIVIKAGRTKAAAKAAASHTGSITGSYEVLNAAFHRTGVLQVNNISDLFHMSELLSKQPPPKGPHLSIITNAGGPGVLATDAIIANGGKLTEMSPETFEAFNQLLPPHWSRNNPIDILGDADPKRYAQAVEIAAKDPNTHGILVILAPQDVTDPTETAERIKTFAHGIDKPIIASWMGGSEVQPGIDILNQNNIPTYDYPDTAAKAFNYMWQYSDNLRCLYEIPTLAVKNIEGCGVIDRQAAAKIIETVSAAKRTILTEAESKQILAAYGIPTVQAHIAKSKEEAVELAEEIGYPIVLKLHSTTITHKTDVGGVQLNLRNRSALEKAYAEIESNVKDKVGKEHFDGVTVQKMHILHNGYELVLGSSLDRQLGPVLLFGLGGQLVEVFKDRALGLPPLNDNLVKDMLRATNIYTALKGIRGRKAVDLERLENIILRFSQLIVEQPLIKESDINPLFASADDLVALDARFILHEDNVDEATKPGPAIRPYPSQYISEWELNNGVKVKIRPIRPVDEPLMVKFHESLSERSVYLRYSQDLDLSLRTAHKRLSRVCFIDYDRRIVLVVTTEDPKSKENIIIAVARLTKTHASKEASCSVLVSDAYQRQGLGTELMHRLIDIARQEGLQRLSASILTDNNHMLRFCDKHGFNVIPSSDDRFVIAEALLTED